MRKVLVPIDSIEYENTLNSIKSAIKYAKGCKVGREEPELIFLHVLTGDKATDRERIDEEFEEVKEMCEDRGVSNIRTIKQEGTPDEEIIETAKKEEIDMIVIGSGKLKNKSTKDKLSRFLYGSVTEDVLHETPCSVLVTRTQIGENK